MDYGRSFEFGISVVPETASIKETRVLVRAADESGLDLVGIQDHPYQWRFLDTWMFIASLLAESKQVRIFPGRRLADVRRMLNLSGTIGEAAVPGTELSGSVEQWVETLTGWATGRGFDTSVLWPTAADTRRIGQPLVWS